MTDLFPELGEMPPAWEVWDSASGNLLLATPDRDEALAEAAHVLRAYGDAALEGLSVGCEPGGTAYRGRELRDLLAAEGFAGGPASAAEGSAEAMSSLPALTVELPRRSVEL